MTAFQRGDNVVVNSPRNPDWNGPAEVVKLYTVQDLGYESVHVVPASGPQKGREGAFNLDEVTLVPRLVEFINREPQVVIDLKKLNPMYNTPLILTVEQATQLLRELDAVIL